MDFRIKPAPKALTEFNGLRGYVTIGKFQWGLFKEDSGPQRDRWQLRTRPCHGGREEDAEDSWSAPKTSGPSRHDMEKHLGEIYLKAMENDPMAVIHVGNGVQFVDQRGLSFTTREAFITHLSSDGRTATVSIVSTKLTRHVDVTNLTPMLVASPLNALVEALAGKAIDAD